MSNVKAVIGVLDDEVGMRQALRRLLMTHDYQVEAYARGEDLLAELSTKQLDCLILDLHMHGINGFEVLQSFGDRHMTLPVIVLSGHDAPGTEKRVRSLGASDYLLKPVDEVTLVAAIERALLPN